MKFLKWNLLNEIFQMKFFECNFFEWNFINERSHIKKSQYFPKPFRNFRGNINVKVDLSNHATKNDLKNVTDVDTSSFARKKI